MTCVYVDCGELMRGNPVMCVLQVGPDSGMPDMTIVVWMQVLNLDVMLRLDRSHMIEIECSVSP